MSYSAPTLLGDALSLLKNPDVSVIAGGTDWYPLRGDTPLTMPVLDITRVDGLRGITKDQQGWRIGATTRWSDVARADLPNCFDGLRAAAREIGSVQIQNAGTVAGNLCNASPAADGVPPLLALNAQVELTSGRGVRCLDLKDFIQGARRVALCPDELMTAVLVPDHAEGTQSSFLKIGSRKYLVISIAMVAVVLDVEGGHIQAARIAVGACSAVAQRLPELESALVGRSAKNLPEITPKFLSSLLPISDVRGSAQYRLEVAAELCRRAILRALASRGQAHG